MAPVKCPSCGAENGPADVFCYKCEARLALEEEGGNQESLAPLVCGLLLLVVGVGGILTWIVALSTGTHAYSEVVLLNFGEYPLWYVYLKLALCAFPLLGASACFKGYYRWALAGACIGLFATGPFFILSIISTCVVSVLRKYRDDFRLTVKDLAQIL